MNDSFRDKHSFFEIAAMEFEEWSIARKALTSGIIITIIIYIGFTPRIAVHGANAFDLALINNHYCTERTRRPTGVPYAGGTGDGGGGRRRFPRERK